MTVTPEWVEYAARQYIRTQAAFDRTCDAQIDRLEELRQRMEGVGAIRYDKEGGNAGFVDNWPDLLDQMNKVVDAMQAHTAQGMDEFTEALTIFRSDRNALACWLHYGQGETWKSVGARLYTSADHLKHERGRGFRFIYDRMPAHYREVRYKAEERFDGK